MALNCWATTTTTGLSSIHPHHHPHPHPVASSFLVGPGPAFPSHRRCKLSFFPNWASSHGLPAAALSSSQRSGGQDDDDPPSYSESSASVRTQLDLLEQLRSTGTSLNGYESDDNYTGVTIRDQLAQLVGDRDDDFSIPLGKNIKKVSPKFLTVAQKRNIKRQAYLNEVSQRNDTVFFATIGAFVVFPPIIILGIAIANGYVQLFP